VRPLIVIPEAQSCRMHYVGTLIVLKEEDSFNGSHYDFKWCRSIFLQFCDQLYCHYSRVYQFPSRNTVNMVSELGEPIENSRSKMVSGNNCVVIIFNGPAPVLNV